MVKNCPLCLCEFRVKPSHFEKRKYCSKVCFNKSKVGQVSPMKGKKHTLETISLLKKQKEGFRHSEETKQKMKGRKAWNKGLKNSQTAWNKGMKMPADWAWNKGLNNGAKEVDSPHWKGDDVGYYGLHAWIRKTLGQPDTCEFCKKNGLTGHKIHWANKSHKYLRDKEDWLRLCAKCHHKYDSEIKQASRNQYRI